MPRRVVKALFFVALMLFLGILLAKAAAQEVLGKPEPRLTLSLEQARDMALANNKQLLLGRLNLEEKQFATSAAKRDYFPKLLGTSYYFHFNDDLGTVIATRERTLGGLMIGPGGILKIPEINIPSRRITANVINQDTAIGALIVAQPITKLIGVSALVDIARADEGIAAAQLDKGTRDLLSGVNQAYYGLLAAQRIKAMLTLQSQALEPIVKANPVPELRLGLLEVRKGLAEVDKNIGELTDLLNQLLGLPPCTCLELVEPALPPITVTCAGEAAELALNNNPEVREAEQNITKARAGLRAAKMEYLPDVNLLGFYTLQSAADYIQEDFAAIGVGASYTFFDWGKRKQVKFQRETQLTLAAENVQAVIQSVDLEARKAFLAYRQAEEDLEIAKEVAAARQDAEKAAKTPGDIMTAKSATAKAQLDLMQAELNYRLAHAKLRAVIGQP